jgi:predicted aspartyl protease
MRLTLKDELPFTTLKIAYEGAEIEVADVLVDTGSASTILSADIVAQIGITPEPMDMLHTVRGIGGTEVVFTRQVDHLQIDQQRLSQFQIEIGGMDYGFDISGILGMDFLIQAGAVINLRNLELEFLNG